ncbi:MULTISPECIES: hypothetical protein [unclassified Paracoccus (in: a-proteobacteria)]|uniref:hypothetical protein n=1 Tax=unclassified Paracoccus (in: a-proteobacteria) TaxID=2688777 RepID=UPI0018A6BD9A|nr:MULTISPECIES: hypothetical protein [unclassified Paracoccus (in: a-proteobacteria)]UXU74473.1 hypothetical protein GB879_011270 [Paracoccus sp. SMMA_5]UXU80365.1 hypothetical protein GB880_011250 [Paracoccus sp. SMMA_5_TC]
MKRCAALLLTGGLLLAPAHAQTPYEPPSADAPTPSTGDALERGLESLMDNLMRQAQPHLDRLGRDLGATLNSFQPVLDELGQLMDDVGNYQAPERLENGDILIRRRPDAPPPPPVGPRLRDLLRPAPQDDSRLNPPSDQTAPAPADQPPPAGSEIEL